MTPTAERQSKSRKARRDAGLVPLSTWVPASRKAEILAVIEEALNWPDKSKPLFVDGVQDYIEGTAEPADSHRSYSMYGPNARFMVEDQPLRLFGERIEDIMEIFAAPTEEPKE